jgi:hypothetical protein
VVAVLHLQLNMYKYKVLVRVENNVILETFIQADSEEEMKSVADAVYGLSNVIEWILVR